MHSSLIDFQQGFGFSNGLPPHAVHPRDLRSAEADAS